MAKIEKFTTPAGIAKFPRLNDPDTKFKQEGEYKVTLVLSAEEAQPIVERLEAAKSAHVAEEKKKLAKGKKLKEADLPVKPHVVKNGDEEEVVDGKCELAFKCRASGVSKKTGEAWERKPRVFDAKGRPLNPVPKIGGGSKLKVAYSIGTYNTPAAGCGVSLRLEAVQLLDLVEFGGGDAKSYGFGEEEDGYEGDSMPDGDSGDTSEADDSGGNANSGNAADY